MVGIRTATALVAMFLAGVFAAAAQAAEDDALREQIKEIVKEEMAKNNGLRAYWKTGLRLDSADKKFKLKLGGRVMIDLSWYDSDDFESLPQPGVPERDVEDGVEFRRVRLYNEGVIYDHVAYKVQIDFADIDNILFKDVYIGLENLEDCLGCLFPDIRLGHFKMPVGLDALTSSKYITFMERAGIMQAFAPARKTGLMLRDNLRGNQIGYALAYWQPGANDNEPGFNFRDGEAFGARVWWAPWYNCDCACQRLHVGASYASYSNLRGARFRSRPPTHMTDRFVNTGTIADAEEFTTLGLELALVYGPWSFQTEYMMASVESTTADDPTFSGYYAYASYWLTGECRPYKYGVFSRVKPCCNFLDEECCCTGAWELKARYEYLDLEDGNVDGGEQTSITVGVNWHLNPNMRVMAEYFLTTVDGTPAGYNGGASTFDDDDISGFQMRFQVDF